MNAWMFIHVYIHIHFLVNITPRSLSNYYDALWFADCRHIYVLFKRDVGVQGAAIFEVEVEHAWSGVT